MASSRGHRWRSIRGRTIRWLFYVSDGQGIGRVSRVLAFARQIRARDKQSKFLFLTDSEATDAIWQEGFASVKLVSSEAAARGLIGADLKDALDPAFVASTVLAFAPDIFVVDSYPIGRTKEIFGIFPTPARRILIYLNPSDSAPEDPIDNTNLGLYELVLAPYDKSEVKPPRIKGQPVAVCNHFVLRSRGEVFPRARARRLLGLPEDAFVVCVGFDAGHDADTLKWVLKQAKRRPDWLFAVPASPLSTNQAPLNTLQNVLNFSYFPLAEVLAAFDAAIAPLEGEAMAELLYHGVPSILVSGPNDSGKDSARASRIAANAAGRVVTCFDDADLDAATDVMADARARAALGAAGEKLIPQNGAESGAVFVLDWLRRTAKAKEPGPPAKPEQPK